MNVKHEGNIITVTGIERAAIRTDGSTTQGTWRKYRRTAQVVVTIDVESLLAQRGGTALNAKSGQTTLADAAIVIRVQPGTLAETDITDEGNPKGGQQA